jgi:hypothetical protein
MFTANPVTFKTAKRCEVLTEVNYEACLSSGMSYCVLQETGTNSVVGTASSMSLSYCEDEAATSSSHLPYVLHSTANKKHETWEDNDSG